jgi:polyhydroxyalkanoate synthesis regulator phasin
VAASLRGSEEKVNKRGNGEGGEMNFWEKVKEDLQKGVEEGIAFVREGASVAKKKAEELTEEGKRRYRLYELKTSVQKEIAELGGKVYDLSAKVRNPMLDSKVKAIKARIKKLETEIAKLEGKLKITPGKSVSKRKSVKKAPERNASTAKRTLLFSCRWGLETN